MFINTDKVTRLGSWFFPLKATLKHRNVFKYNIQLLFNTSSLSFCENNTTRLKIQHYRATHPTWICEKDFCVHSWELSGTAHPTVRRFIIKILLTEGTSAALKGFVWGGRGGECHSACFSPAGSRGECRVDIYSGQCHLQHQGQTFRTNNRLCDGYDLAFETTCCLMIVREFLCVCAAASWRCFYFFVKINWSPVARPTAAPAKPKSWAEDSQERRDGYNECVW